ncbi:expressed unknown protein [Seminavis robusta]|uniref:Uncharacterized protein n=1 Tax=Seminavis robusta TaxID=568900 RepID=A0A9N8F469_9STRA|nr:expressed unknown protein [Seminavis robusta]|eukprot:Sro2884_g339340.1 n/a (835) ;mRNA; r:6910-9414
MMEEEDYYGISKDYSSLSTRELLAELDKRNIRYAPTTSREDLEFLLLEGMQDEHDDQLLVDEESEMAFLMRELASMGIRLPRYASRDELEVLLRRAKQNPERFMETTAKRPKRPRPSMSPTQRRRRRQHVAISRLRRELNELGIPCPPGASPKMMERLLRESEGQFTPDRGPPRTRRDVYPPRRDRPEQPDVDTRKLLWDELNRRGIRFSPTSTRKELESLLHNSQQNHNASARPPPSKRNRENFRVNTDSVPEARAPKEQSANDADNVFEKNADKERNVGVDVGSSKEGSRSAHRETDDETKKSFDKFSTTTDVPNRSRETTTSSERRTRTRQSVANSQRPSGPSRKRNSAARSGNPRDRVQRSLWSKVYDRSKQTVADSVKTIPDYAATRFDGATSRVSNAAERAARKAREATRNARDFFAEDENGIRDVEFEYVTKTPDSSKDVIIDVPAEPVEDRTSNRYTKRERYASRARAAANTGGYQTRPARSGRERNEYRTPQGGSDAPATKQNHKPSSVRNPAVSSSLFRLPPAKSTGTQGREGNSASKTRRRRRTSSANDGSRRVYSPYDENDPSSQVYRDAIDRFGEFFVSATDTILWGNEEDDEDSNEENSTSATKPGKGGKARAGRKQSANWRDRMEERFDSMMGIHDQGAYYNRWTSQEELDEDEAGGHDAFSVAQGRAPKRRRRKKFYEKPFWEENNLFSTLLGKSPPSYDGGVGNILPFIKTGAKTLIIATTNACEWASVRGSLPQPVVVVGVTSCVLSARPGKRLLTLVLSLVAFRIFGELIHEGLHGGEDWEEDGYDDDDDGYDGDDEKEKDQEDLNDGLRWEGAH